MLNRILILACIVCLSGGCVSQRQTFEGHDADEVWTAMLAVARTPDYHSLPVAERWTVRENHVWVEPGTNHMEIMRRLERVRYQPASHPRYDDRTWKLQVVMEERDPPTVKFTSRELGVPSHTWDEADLFFNEVWEVLGGKPVQPVEEPQPQEAQPSAGERYDN